MNTEELRTRRDLWPIVAARLPEAMRDAEYHLLSLLDQEGLMEHLERKFRKGEAEHDRDWVRRNNPGSLLQEAAEEVLDFLLYQAMYLVLLEAKANDDE